MAVALRSVSSAPPHNLEAEEALLGAMMVSRKALSEALARLSDDDFYAEVNRFVFQACRSLAAEGNPVDPVSVSHELAARDVLGKIGDVSYLSVLVSSATVAPSVGYYSDLIADLARKRALLDVMTEVSTSVQSGQGSADELLDRLTAHLAVVPRSGQPRIRLYSIAQLRALPTPVDLIEGVMSKNVLTTLWGPSGHGKSLIALDIGLSVALGRSWYGRPVTRGPVVMVIAEGISATSLRIDAWLSNRDEKEPDNFYAVGEAINLFREEDPQAFVRAVDQFGVTPSLVVFDTLARSMVGGEENSAKDMGLVIDAADWIRSKSGATVLIVHHSGRNMEHERGSTALFGACDTVVSSIQDEDGVIEIQSRKQKDRVDFESFRLGLLPVDKSVVLVDNLVPNDSETPPRSATSVLASLWQSFGTKPVSSTSWLDVSDVPKRTFHRAKKWLVEHGLVTESGTEKRPIYTISDQGTELMVP